MNNYQELAARTLIDKPDFKIPAEEQQLLQDLLKLAVLTGRAIELAKKGILHRHGMDYRSLNLTLLNIVDHVQEVREGNPSSEPWSLLTDPQIMEVWNTFGLVGEASEVAEKVYQSVTDNLRPDLFKELGDTSWYIAALCTKLDYSMKEVMEANIEKLRKRYPEGYSSEDSKKRVDIQGEDK